MLGGPNWLGQRFIISTFTLVNSKCLIRNRETWWSEVVLSWRQLFDYENRLAKSV